ncbi:MAG: hypothetical protein CMM60_02130 [Rhodospirillaceae bacterium]|nr:hypothetical protein [Rhodospirillaceae bacterium]
MTVRWISSFIGILLMTAAFSAQAQQLVVITSGAPSLKPGQVVKSGTAIEIPAGASVTLVSETGKTVTLKGPFSGPAKAGGQGGGQGDGQGDGKGGGDAKLIASLSGLLSGSGKETGSLGAMRAAAPPKPPSDAWVIDTGKSGDVCVQAKGPVMLWREKAAKARILTLKNLTDKSKSKAEWPAGSATLEWPSKVTIADGARYLLRMKGSRAARKLKLHLVPGGLASDAHRAVWMARNGCEKQAMRLLAGLR